VEGQQKFELLNIQNAHLGERERNSCAQESGSNI
jgi:hypothetical protein